jgi:hypothetical protein
MCLLKSKKWSYEHEWRIVSAEGEASATRPIEMPNPSAIILGVHTQEADRAEMADICATRGILLKKVVQRRDDFRLEVVES